LWGMIFKWTTLAQNCHSVIPPIVYFHPPVACGRFICTTVNYYCMSTYINYIISNICLLYDSYQINDLTNISLPSWNFWRRTFFLFPKANLTKTLLLRDVFVH
jgi:hypothetical protein